MSDQGSEGSKSSNKWAELTPDCLFSALSNLSVKEILDGPMKVCKSWRETGNRAKYSVFDYGTRTAPLPPFEKHEWKSMNIETDGKMDALLQTYVDRSEGGLKSIKIALCTDQSISYVADRCPNLEVLWVMSCPRVSDASIFKIASNCKNLKELLVHGSTQITEKSLNMVKQNCPNVNIKRDY